MNMTTETAGLTLVSWPIRFWQFHFALKSMLLDRVYPSIRVLASQA